MDSNPNALIPGRGFIKADDQIFVTIGRNVSNGDPGPEGQMAMTDGRWDTFVHDVADQLGALLKPSATFGPFYGTGEWEGVTEESAVWSLTVGYTSRVEHVESILSTLARSYGQDAIAWTSAASHLARS